MASSAAAAEAVLKGSEASSGTASPLPDQSTLVFVIPVYNEEENVPRLLADFETRPGCSRPAAGSSSSTTARRTEPWA